MPAPVLLWILLACFVVLPVLAAFIGDEPPANEITQEQENPPRQDPDAEFAEAA